MILSDQSTDAEFEKHAFMCAVREYVGEMDTRPHAAEKVYHARLDELDAASTLRSAYSRSMPLPRLPEILEAP